MADLYDDHELVIMTFNRPRYLYRLLDYVASDLPIGRVRVVDGSTEPHRSENTRVVASFAHRMPVCHDLLVPGIDVLDHARHAYGCAETPFMTLCHDDNFCVPAAVREQVEYLRAHPDYVNCCGLVTGVAQVQGRVSAYVSDAVGLEQNDPLERVAHFVANHWSADFGTWRSAARREAVPLLDFYELDEGIGEPLTCGISALAGKFRLIPRVSVVFCVHETNRGGSSGERKSNLIRADFMSLIECAGDVLAGYCRRYGVAPPVDAGAWYLAAYLRYMGKWWHQYQTMAAGLRREAEASLPPAEIAAIDARAGDALLDDLLQLDEADAAAIRHMTGQLEKQPDPTKGVLLAVTGREVVVADILASREEPEVVLALPQATVLPKPYAALCRSLRRPDWHAAYAAFRDRTLGRVLGAHAGRGDATDLFDAACLVAFAQMLRPLDGAHPDRVPYLARVLSIHAETSRVRDDLLGAMAHVQAYATPSGGANDQALTAPEPLPSYRILFRSPLPGSMALPFVPGQVRHVRDVAFIPLDLSGDPARWLARDHQLWLSVDVAEVQGRVQFSLYSRGSLDILVVVSADTGPCELHFPLRTADVEYLVMRDISVRGVTGRCTIAGIRWRTSPRPIPVFQCQNAPHWQASNLVALA